MVLLSKSAAGAARGHLFRPGADASNSGEPLLLGDTAVGIDSHRRLDAADPAATSTRSLRRRRWRPRWRARRLGVRRDAARATAAAADPRHPQRPDAPRQRRDSASSSTSTSTTSSASSARSFNAVSEQLSADRSQMAGQVANLESAVEHLEDAVAIVNPRGELLFANPAMRALLPAATTGATLDRRAARGSSAAAARSSRRWSAASRAVRYRRRSARSGERLIDDPRRSTIRRASCVGVDADRAQPRVPEPGPVDDPLLAQAGGARPAVGRRRARSEESAQRDDDSPRAAAAAVRRQPGPGRGRTRRRRRHGAQGGGAAPRGAVDDDRSDPARRRDRERNPAARSRSCRAS